MEKSSMALFHMMGCPNFEDIIRGKLMCCQIFVRERKFEEGFFVRGVPLKRYTIWTALEKKRIEIT